jgi:hypothetical protein
VEVEDMLLANYYGNTLSLEAQDWQHWLAGIDG